MRKPIFETVRKLLGRGLQQGEVDQLDRAIDSASSTESVIPNPVNGLQTSASTPSAIGPDGINLIKQFEGCARRRSDGQVEAYPDPGTGGAPWTIGWGATGKNIGPGTIWSQAECDRRLEQDLIRYADDVRGALRGKPATQSQFDALVSFHYNTGAIAKATLTRLHKAGDFAGAAREFSRWVNAGGRPMRGLIRRREAEAMLYQKGM